MQQKGRKGEERDVVSRVIVVYLLCEGTYAHDITQELVATLPSFGVGVFSTIMDMMSRDTKLVVLHTMLPYDEERAEALLEEPGFDAVMAEQFPGIRSFLVGASDVDDVTQTIPHVPCLSTESQARAFAVGYCLNTFRIPEQVRHNIRVFVIHRPDGVEANYLMKALVPSVRYITLTLEKERGRDGFMMAG
jgi:hypothetical protein